MKNSIIIFLISLFIIIGCTQTSIKNERQHNYDVMYTLYNNITVKKMVDFAFPAPPPYSSINIDSILESYKEKDTTKMINSLIKRNGKLIVAIDSVLESPYLSDIKKEYIQECLKLNFEEVYISFENLHKKLSVDVSQIQMNDYSFIIPYRNYYKDLKRKGYEKFNMSLKFSRIAYNKNYTKAIVIMGAGFGKLNGFSAMYFLEKENSKWIIKCEKGLSIS